MYVSREEADSASARRNGVREGHGGGGEGGRSSVVVGKGQKLKRQCEVKGCKIFGE